MPKRSRAATIDKKLRANSARAKEDCGLPLLDERTFRIMIEETLNLPGM
jgi:hypothetical protein